MSTAVDVRIVEFGPCRAIGMSVVAKNEQGEFHDLWMNQFMPRKDEIEAMPGVGMFGICRCAAGAEDGAFEYIAAVPAKPEAEIPKGMLEAPIPKGTYAVFTIPNLAGIGQGWSESLSWINSSPEWRGYCNPTDCGCDCIDNPSFELYPPDFNGENELYIYVPVRRFQG